MAGTAQQEFFKKKRTPSEIKTELLPAFFNAWCSHFLHPANETPVPELIFLDANAGPGQDQEQPTAPLVILEEVVASTNTPAPFNLAVTTCFTDENKRVMEALRFQIEFWRALKGEVALKEPLLVTEENKLGFAAGFNLNDIPALLALDPFSYPLAQDLATQALEKNNTDLFLLFSYAKLKTALLQDPVAPFLKQLFGETETAQVRNIFKLQANPKRAEAWLLQTLTIALTQAGFTPLPFKINTPPKGQPGFYLILASKNPAIYLLAKEWLYPYSDCQEDGVPLWGVNLNYVPPSIPGFSKYISAYGQENLIADLAGQKSDCHFKTVQEIYLVHGRGKPYVLANYVTALAALRTDGVINCLDEQNKQVKTIKPNTVIFYRLHRVPSSNR